jgi:Putative collagen-binding domain of a collagenase
LFSGEFPNVFRCRHDGHPFSRPNNVNGIDDGGGIGSMTMTAPNAVSVAQDAYVDKMIDTLNDLPNVLWIVSQEAPPSSTWWNNHLIAHVRSYESGKPLQHPIGYAVLADSTDTIIYNSDADWVAPGTKISPAATYGTGTPRRKVNINDSDHSYFGMWNDTAEQNRAFVWKNFLNGNQVLFMDPYLTYYPRENRNLCLSPVHGICSAPDPRWDNFRDNLGYARRYANRMNLAAMTPQGKLFSNRYGLANAIAKNAEYLGYTSSGNALTINLSATPGTLSVEWFNPSTGATVSGSTVTGGNSQTLTSPFSSDAVVYLRNSR